MAPVYLPPAVEFRTGATMAWVTSSERVISNRWHCMEVAEVEREHEQERAAQEHTAIPANVVHKAVLKQGREELARTSSALAWSGVAGGLSVSLSFLAEALLRAHVPDQPWAPLVTKLGYPVGFLVLVLGRQQLFTENTLTAVLPLLEDKSMATLTQVARLWLVVLVANLTGIHLAAWFYAATPAVELPVRQAMHAIGNEVFGGGFFTVLVKGIVAGWLIALVVWLKAAVDHAEFAAIVVPTYLVGLGAFSHIVVGSVEVLFLVMSGSVSWFAYVGAFFVPALIGNCLGGVLLVAALNHAQVVSGKASA